LGAIVMSAALSIIDYSEAIFLWKMKEHGDLIQFVMSCVAVAFFGPIVGVACAGLLSLVQVIYWSSRPAVVALGRMPGFEEFLDVVRFPQCQRHPGVIIVSLGAPRLSFYNIAWFRENLDTKVAINNGQGNKIHSIICDLRALEQMDSTGLLYMKEMSSGLKEKGVKLVWSHVRKTVKDVLTRGGVTARNSDDDNVFATTHEALEAIMAEDAEKHAQAQHIGLDVDLGGDSDGDDPRTHKGTTNSMPMVELDLNGSVISHDNSNTTTNKTTDSSTSNKNKNSTPSSPSMTDSLISFFEYTVAEPVRTVLFAPYNENDLSLI